MIDLHKIWQIVEGAEMCEEQLLWISQPIKIDLEAEHLEQLRELHRENSRIAALHGFDWEFKFKQKEKLDILFGRLKESQMVEKMEKRLVVARKRAEGYTEVERVLQRNNVVLKSNLGVMAVRLKKTQEKLM